MEMKLLTKEIIDAMPKLYENDKTPLEDKIVICKFFTPGADWTWFVFEGEIIKDEDKAGNEIDDFLFFGMVHGFEKECGYFCLNELKRIRTPLGLPIERDLHVFKKPYRELVKT